MSEPIDLTVVGDVMVGRSVADSIRALGFEVAAERVRSFWNAPSVVGNLECPLCECQPESEFKADGGPNLRSDPAMAGWLARAGFTAMSLANNHAMDCGGEGLRQTLDALAKVGIAAFGAGLNLHEALRPLVISLGHVRVAMLAFGNGDPAGTDQPGTAPLTSAAVAEGLRRVPAGVDAKIVFLHGGLEFLEVPESWTRRLAREAIAWGADAVIGGHPHCLRGVHTVRGKPVLYSLGDFIADTADHRHLGAHIGRTAMTIMNFPIAEPFICRRSLLADLRVRNGGRVEYGVRFALVGEDFLPTQPAEEQAETLKQYLGVLSAAIDDHRNPAARRLARVERAYRRTIEPRRSLRDWMRLPFRVSARRLRLWLGGTGGRRHVE